MLSGPGSVRWIRLDRFGDSRWDEPSDIRIEARLVSRLEAEAVYEIDGSMSPAPTTGIVWLLLSSSPNSCKLPDEFFASTLLSAIVLRGELGSRTGTGSNGFLRGVGIFSPFLENLRGVGRFNLNDTLFLAENFGVLS